MGDEPTDIGTQIEDMGDRIGDMAHSNVDIGDKFTDMSSSIPYMGNGPCGDSHRVLDQIDRCPGKMQV